MKCWKCRYASQSQSLLIKHIIKKHPSYVHKTEREKESEYTETREKQKCDKILNGGLKNKTLFHYNDHESTFPMIFPHDQAKQNITSRSVKYFRNSQSDGIKINLNKIKSKMNVNSSESKSEKEGLKDLDRMKDFHDNGNKTDEASKEYFICQYCNTSFNNWKQYEYHLDVHYNIKDQARYHCDICGINCETKQEINQHKRKHFSKYKKNKKTKHGRSKNKNFGRHIQQEQYYHETLDESDSCRDY